MVELRWSPPSRDDDVEWIDLLAAMEAVDERGETYELADLDDEWESVWSHPDTDATFVWHGTQLVAFAWLKTTVGQREAHRIGCWGGVRPSHRRQGIGTELFAWTLRRATEIAGTLDGALPTKVQMDAADQQRDLLAVATKAGFEPVRRFLEVARPIELPIAAVDAPAGLELAPWTEDLDEATRLTHVEAFADHWGSEPRTQEEWRQWYTGHRSFRPDLSVLAVDAASGDVVSFVLCAAYPQDWASVPREAWITSVGTRRTWRGKAVARWLLSDSLDRMARSDTGFERAILGVDADNPTGALGLYRSLGFEDVRAVTNLSRPPLA
ncbi:MAG: GNAT family N-acetyltransferase [Acidimicrobiales bacterium]